MIGKKLKVNDYKFTYGEEVMYLNVFSAFKDKKGNKYIIYNYEDKPKQLFYGSCFRSEKNIVIMTSKENPKDIIKDFIENLLNSNYENNYNIIPLEDIQTVEVIDEYTDDFDIDINKLYDLTIPKPLIKEERKKVKKQKKPISISMIFFILFILVIIAFLFFNPEVIIGKDRVYSCTKNYSHKKLPASVTEDITLTFSGRSIITSINLTTDYKFNNINYYIEFKDKSYYYQYMNENDTYKFIDEKYTYRLFAKIDTENEEYILPKEEAPLIDYYEGKGYKCKRVETDE